MSTCSRASLYARSSRSWTLSGSGSVLSSSIRISCCLWRCWARPIRRCFVVVGRSATAQMPEISAPRAVRRSFSTRAVGILAHHADADGRRTERRQIGRDRAGPAAPRLRLRHPQDGDGGLRTDPGGVAVDVDIEHEVAGDENLRRAQVSDRLEQLFVHSSLNPLLFLRHSYRWGIVPPRTRSIKAVSGSAPAVICSSTVRQASGGSSRGPAKGAIFVQSFCVVRISDAFRRAAFR